METTDTNINTTYEIFGNRAPESGHLMERLAAGIDRTRAHLLHLQSPEGFWAGELEADASVTAGYLPLMHFLKGTVDEGRKSKIVASLLRRQAVDGSWSVYTDGPGDLSVSIQVYFSLKLSGIPESSPLLSRAREFILGHGGIAKANLFTKLWLALFGQFDWRGVPLIPPEIMLLPAWSPFNIYDLASWSRATIVALSVVTVRKPVCEVPAAFGVSELYAGGKNGATRIPWYAGPPLSLRGAAVDELLRLWERLPLKPLRRTALRQAQRWIIEHQESDGSWAGIMLPYIYSLVALKSLGCAPESPAMVRGIEQLDTFLFDDGTEARLQPATSPVWDTAWTILALSESGMAASHESLRRGARWLLDREISTAGDWRIKNPSVKPGCWSFEHVNNWYPDIDDTAEVVRALSRVEFASQAEERRRGEAIQRGMDWILGMQSRDGGWAAFDRDNNHRMLECMPFADFMAPLDPTCPDVTAHVVELLGERAFQGSALPRALAFLRASQGSAGAWHGRWGVNYVYGTGMTLSAIQTIDDRSLEGISAKANEWLVSCQLKDGSWGESCATYWDPLLAGAGDKGTPSQTAWALMGLAGNAAATMRSARKGLEYLLSEQRPDGSWEEAACTGAGFPKAFYLRYDLYRIYFPLIALSKWERRLRGANGASAESVQVSLDGHAAGTPVMAPVCDFKEASDEK